MAIKINGTNTAAAPGITGDDTDTGLVYGTNQVDISTGGSSRVTVDSNGYLGIGTSSPGQLLSLKNTSAQCQQSLTAATNGSCAIYFGDTDSVNRSLIYHHNTGDYLAFYTTGSERMRILSDGGLTFNGDTATANALHDYEEGSWTPDPWDGTCSVADARYIKIGGKVTIWAKCSNFSDTSTNDLIGIKDLPFSSISQGCKGSAQMQYADDPKTTVYFSSVPRLHFFGGNTGGYTQLRHNEINNNDFEVYFIATYDTTA